jgi:hypothetical protein
MLVVKEGFARALLPWVLVCLPTLSMGDVLPDSLIACTELSADTARLACFDRQIREIRKKPTNPPAAIELTPEQKFGLSDGQVRGREAKRAEPPTDLHAHIVSVSQYINERQVFVLDNRQVWQQIELDPDFTAKSGQEVVIAAGALGSYWLSTAPRHRTRVKRIQ